jgi:hypothetical protein
MDQHADQGHDAASKADQQGDIRASRIGCRHVHRYLPWQYHADTRRRADVPTAAKKVPPMPNARAGTKLA